MYSIIYNNTNTQGTTNSGVKYFFFAPRLLAHTKLVKCLNREGRVTVKLVFDRKRKGKEKMNDTIGKVRDVYAFFVCVSSHDSPLLFMFFNNCVY